MILVIGGRGQGKREFALQNLIPEDEAPMVRWASGRDVGWESYMKSRYCCDFHLFIRRLMNREVGVGAGGNPWMPGDQKQMEVILKALLQDVPDRILVTDEIGYGIVPADAAERQYREETGRLCCLAAKEARQVWRVLCGLGQRIK